MNKAVLQLAKEAGATNETGGSIDAGVICFTLVEFEDFLRRFMAHHLEEVGVVQEDCNGHPWKRLGYTAESILAEQAIGTKVYVVTNLLADA